MKRKVLRVFYFSLFLVFAISCNQNRPENILSGEAQGTTYTIKYIGQEQPLLSDSISKLLTQIDQSMSTWVKDSKISLFNQGDSVKMDAMFEEVFELSIQANKLSDGAFDPGIGPLIEAWGFDYTEAKALDSNAVDSLLLFSGMEQFKKRDKFLLKKDSRAKINFNAVAQGYSVDKMGEVIESFGIQDYYVELGGEVKVHGKSKRGDLWKIGIDKPEGTNLERELKAIVNLSDKAVVTSGNYRKFVVIDGEKFSHSINPQTGYPEKQNLLSATVICESGAMADALATACMVKGLEGSKNLIESQSNLEAILIYDQNGSLQTYISPGLKDAVEVLD